MLAPWTGMGPVEWLSMSHVAAPAAERLANRLSHETGSVEDQVVGVTSREFEHLSRLWW